MTQVVVLSGLSMSLSGIWSLTVYSNYSLSQKITKNLYYRVCKTSQNHVYMIEEWVKVLDN